MTDDDPIRLDEAAKRYGLSVGTLRWERRQGRLKNTFKLGRQIYTTMGDLKNMEEEKKCRDGSAGQQRERDYTSTRNDSNGLSETAHVSAARAAAEMIAKELSGSSKSTSVRNSSRKLATIP
jgi:hypothetical protein